MDIEADVRLDFIETFGEWFHIEENVPIFSPIWNLQFKADLVIKSREEIDACFAVEVKNKEYWKPRFYSEAFAQTTFYNYCIISKGRWKDSMISASFVFQNDIEFGRNEREKYTNVGIERLGQQLKVGVADIEKRHSVYQRSRLRFGPNEFWRSDIGFNMHSQNLISGKRKLGGTKKDYAFFKNRIHNLIQKVK